MNYAEIQPCLWLQDLPKRLYRIGVQRWAETPVERPVSDSKPSAVASQEGTSDVVGDGAILDSVERLATLQNFAAR